MEIFNLQNDLEVFGNRVKTFPNGISDAFDSLVKRVGGFNRPFYGISYMKDGSMIYLATALEENKAEAEKYKCDRYKIEKGEYFTETIRNWRKKTGSINDVFAKMMKDAWIDRTKPAVEWYKNDDEMLCRVKTVVK